MNNASEPIDIDPVEDEDVEDFELPPEPPAQVAAQAPAPAPAGKRRGRPTVGVGAVPRAPGRPRGKAGDVPDRFDPQAKGPQNWSSHQADVLFPELITWLESNGRSAYDVMVNVIRVEPPPRASVGEGFEANAAVGDTSTTPSDALTRIVSDYYHLPVSRTPAKYELQFVWRANGNYITNAYLSLASPAEIIALRNAQHQRRMNMSYQQASMGLGSPGIQALPPMPHQQQQPQQQAAMPYIPFGYAPPPQAPAAPARDSRMELELERLRMENERLRMDQQRRQHPPQQQRPGPGGYGPPAEDPETRIVRRVVEELRGAGFGAVPATAALATTMPPPSDAISTMRATIQMMREFRRFSDEASGMFEPEDTGVGSPPALPAAPEPADDPYDVTELPSQWGDGSHTKLVRSKETGKVDLLGLALHNPYPSQKLLEVGAEFMKRFAVRGAPPGFAGAPPEYQQQPDPRLQQQSEPQLQQPQSPEPQQQPEQPASEPVSNEPGWEDLG